MSGPRALRMMHTSDWHIGIELGTQSRRQDHEAAIASLVEHCKEFQPDAIIHTGDLFDHARPGAEDQALAVEALRQLSGIAPTVLVGGNHDNSVMLDRAWGPLASLAGADKLMIRGRVRRPEEGGVVAIPDADGSRRILVCTVPFVTRHSFARFDLADESATAGFTAGIKRIHDTYETWLKANADPATDKVIWAAHLLVHGARLGGSERTADVGDDFATTAAQIPPVSYAAFGHIHRAQELPGLITGRYAGGMLPFRFDETREGAPVKSIVLVELPPNGAPKMEVVPIETGRRLIEITERLEDLPTRAEELAGNFVRVTVPVDEPTPGLLMRVIDALPAAIVVEVRPVVTTSTPAGQTASVREASSLDEMLDEWLSSNALSGADPERAAATVHTMVAAATSGRRIPLDDEDLLDPDIAHELIREIADAVGWADDETEDLAAEILASAAAATPATDAGTADASEDVLQ